MRWMTDELEVLFQAGKRNVHTVLRPVLGPNQLPISQAHEDHYPGIKRLEREANQRPLSSA
jgi:hypothetical protein